MLLHDIKTVIISIYSFTKKSSKQSFISQTNNTNISLHPHLNMYTSGYIPFKPIGNFKVGWGYWTDSTF